MQCCKHEAGLFQLVQLLSTVLVAHELDGPLPKVVVHELIPPLRCAVDLSAQRRQVAQLPGCLSCELHSSLVEIPTHQCIIATSGELHRTCLVPRQRPMSVFPALDDVGNYAEITRRERVYLTLAALQFAVNQVLASFQRHDPNWSHIREAEVDVSLVKPDYILAGNIDPKASVADTVELVDFKS